MSQNNPLKNNALTLSFKTTEQAISIACEDGGGQIAAIRADLARWSAGQPKAVQNAVANLDGWLEAAERVDPHANYDGVVVVDCVKRAVETLRRAQHEFAEI